MLPVYSIIRSLGKTAKRTDKLAILKRNSDNEQLKRVFYLTLHPDINFGIQQVPEITKTKAETRIEEALDFLEFNLATRKVTGNQARDQLQSLLESLSSVDQTIILSILNRNLDCGVSIATVKSVWPGLIETCDFMLASTDTKGLKFPDVYCQVKYDGMRVSASLAGNDVILRTRNNSKIDCPQHLEHEIKQILSDSEFLDGELLCFTMNNDHQIRQTGNGVLNKLIKGTASSDEILTIHFIVWDVVNKQQSIPYMFRLDDLNQRVRKKELKSIHIAEGRSVDTLDQLLSYFQEQLALGFEGIVAKNKFHIWQPKRSKDWVKFKDIKTADLKITKIIPGSGKYAGVMGSLELSSEDGLVLVSVGTGFSDAQRELLNNSKIIGQVVEVAYNSRISSKGKVDSLYLPRFIRFRSEEKAEADFSRDIS